MSDSDHMPSARVQASPAYDYLAALLRQGKEPLEMLLALAPDEPLGPPEGGIMVQKRGVGWVPGERQRWPKSVHALRDKFPGYQPGYHFQEEMRYRRTPGPDAPLKDWVVAVINHAKVAWFRAIDGKRTKLQFKAWMPVYLEDDVRCWRGAPGSGRDQANQVLRIACGLPRYYKNRSEG